MEIKLVMKTTYFSFLFLLLFSVAFSQAKPTFGFYNSSITPSLFDVDKTNTMVVFSIETLGKTVWEDYPNAYSINLLPKNFNWCTDVRRIESYKNMAWNQGKQDMNGQDFPIDVHMQAIQGVYSKSPAYR